MIAFILMLIALALVVIELINNPRSLLVWAVLLLIVALVLPVALA